MASAWNDRPQRASSPDCYRHHIHDNGVANELLHPNFICVRRAVERSADHSLIDMDARRIAWIGGGVLFGAVMSGASHGSGPRSSELPPAANTLQVLPKDLPPAEVIQLMARYGQELGVSCVFCHAQNAQTQQVDFVSEENPMKQVARIMIGMVRDINDKYLAQVGDRRYAVPISCGNCHQGQTYPPAFEPATRP
jgi:hypothetical protein